MTNKKKQHYFPKLHLKYWENKKGNFFYYQKSRDGTIKPNNLKNRVQVCYSDYLYNFVYDSKDIFGFNKLGCQYVEDQLSDIENDTAPILEKMIKDISLSELERKKWCNYIYTLLTRSPKSILEMENYLNSKYKEYKKTFSINHMILPI